MDQLYELLQSRIREYEEENKLLWNAVRNVAWQSHSLAEARKYASDAIDATCPFLPLIKADEAKEDGQKEGAAA